MTPAKKYVAKHAKFGSPSGLYAIEKCPGKIAFGMDIPEPPSSEHALEGTEFHKHMELYSPLFLEERGDEVVDYLQSIEFKYEDMEFYLWESLNELDKLWKSFTSKHNKCEKYFELKINFGEDVYGTSDVVFVGVNKKTGKTDCVCIDWKYGKGVRVSAEENLQGIAYGIGAVNTLKLSNVGVCMVIIAQVRLNNWSRFTFEGDEIGMWRRRIEEIVQKAKDVYEGKLPLLENMAAGEHCRFCKALSVCPKQKELVMGAVESKLEELPLEELVKKLTLDEQVSIFLKKGLIEDFLEAVAKNLNHALQTGAEHHAVKLVRTNGRRGWKEEVTAEDLIAAGIKDPYEKKLIGITKAIKQVGENGIKNLLTTPEGKIELVRADDKRPAIACSRLENLE